MMLKLWVVVAVVAVASKAEAGIVGSYESTRNALGYIDLNPKSVVYKGNVSLKISPKEDIDRRTPSRIRDEDYLTSAGTLRADSIAARIAGIRRAERAAFLLECTQDNKKEISDYGCPSLFDQPQFANHKLIVKWNKKKLT